MSDDYDLDAGPDPATVAAAAAEPVVDADEDPVYADEDPVYAVGIGPGSLEYLTPRGEQAICAADVVVGFGTVVDFVAERIPTDTDVLRCGYRDEAEMLDRFAERVATGERGTAVLMGDPNHSGYQFVGKVEQAVREATVGAGTATPGRESTPPTGAPTPVRVVPGISSLQMAASRARTPMEDTEFVTLHKSGSLEADLKRLRRAVTDRHLLVLPRPYDLMPGDLAADLLEAGADPDLDALVLEKLTHPDEAIHRFTLGELSEYAGGDGPAETPFSDLVVLAVRQPTTAASTA